MFSNILRVVVGFAFAYICAGMSRPASACLGVTELGCVYMFFFGACGMRDFFIVWIDLWIHW